MKLSKNTWIVIVAAAIVIVYFLMKGKKKETAKVVVPPPAPTPTPIVSMNPYDLNSLVSQSMQNKAEGSEVGYTPFGSMCPEGKVYNQNTLMCEESGYRMAAKRCGEGEIYNLTTKQCEPLFDAAYANHMQSGSSVSGKGGNMLSSTIDNKLNSRGLFL